MINRKLVLWIEGSDTEETGSLLCEELKNIGYTVTYVKFSEDLPLLEVNSRLQWFKAYESNTQILIIVGSLFNTLAKVIENPYLSGDFEKSKLFELEASLMPNCVIPTHVILLQHKGNSLAKLENLEKILTDDQIKEALRPHKVALVKMNYPLEERIKVIYDLLK